MSGFWSSWYWADTYFSKGYFGPESQEGDVTAVASITESGDVLFATATSDASHTFSGGSFSRPYYRPEGPKLRAITASLSVQEQGDSCSATVELGPSPVDIDNNLLLMAA